MNRRRTEKISEVIAREIVRDMRGLVPGTMLPPEAKLLERYQVGRASLREALRVLEVQGLIVIRPGPGGGPMVAQLDSSNFGRMASLYFHMAGATYRDVLHARLILEPVVAGMVARHHDPEHVETLEEFMHRPATTSPDVPTLGSAPLSDVEIKALEFHAMLMDMAGNPVISLVARSLQDLRVDRQNGRVYEDPDVGETHDKIAQAIVDGLPDLAEQLMREHMQEYARALWTLHPAHLDETVSWH